MQQVVSESMISTERIRQHMMHSDVACMQQNMRGTAPFCVCLLLYQSVLRRPEASCSQRLVGLRWCSLQTGPPLHALERAGHCYDEPDIPESACH